LIVNADQDIINPHSAQAGSKHQLWMHVERQLAAPGHMAGNIRKQRPTGIDAWADHRPSLCARLIGRAHKKNKHERKAGQEGITTDRRLPQQVLSLLTCSSGIQQTHRYSMVCLLKPKGAKLTWKHSFYPRCHPCRCLCRP